MVAAIKVPGGGGGGGTGVSKCGGGGAGGGVVMTGGGVGAAGVAATSPSGSPPRTGGWALCCGVWCCWCVGVIMTDGGISTLNI